jgi:poly(A) polymerase
LNGALPDRLPDLGWLSQPPLSRVLAVLNDPEVETRIVGGAVRDVLLGNSPGDVDLATTGTSDVIAAKAEGARMKVAPTGLAHGTVTVIAGGRAFEVTTLRHDVETHGRHATVAFGADWEQDARRRDFTMNALYADRDGRLYDPVGGYGDLMARRVRFIGEADARIREDYLRILRFFRFHAQYGSGEPDATGFAAAVRARAGLLGLSAERIRQETLRLLVAPGAVATVQIMSDAGILGIVSAGVNYGPAFSRYVAIETAAGTAPDPVMRLAALTMAIPEDAQRLGDRLRLSNAVRKRLLAAVEGWWRIDPQISDGDRKALLYRCGAAAYADRVALAFARSGARADDRDWRSVSGLPRHWTAPKFPIRGADLVALGQPRGPMLGRILAHLEADWIAEGFAADRETLLKRAAELLRQDVPNPG